MSDGKTQRHQKPYLGGGEAREEVSGGVAEGLEAALAIVPRVGVVVAQVVMAQLALAARVLAGALVGRGLAAAEAALVGDLALLAVVARPDAIALGEGICERRRRRSRRVPSLTFCLRRWHSVQAERLQALS